MKLYYILTALVGLFIILLVFLKGTKPYTNKEWEEEQDKEWKNQVKKILYREKPIAKIVIDPELFDEGFLFYTANTSIGEIAFKIPIEEGSSFKDEEYAQLLIRWLL